MFTNLVSESQSENVVWMSVLHFVLIRTQFTVIWVQNTYFLKLFDIPQLNLLHLAPLSNFKFSLCNHLASNSHKFKLTILLLLYENIEDKFSFFESFSIWDVHNQFRPEIAFIIRRKKTWFVNGNNLRVPYLLPIVKRCFILQPRNLIEFFSFKVKKCDNQRMSNFLTQIRLNLL